MTAVPRLRNEWQRRLGPFHTTDEVASVLHVDGPAVPVLARHRYVLEVRDDQSRALYPTFAIPPRVGPQDLKRVLDALATSTREPWLWALWLSGSLVKHGGRCAIDDIADGGLGDVLNRARNEDWTYLAV
jgi:hypothetical protein